MKKLLAILSVVLFANQASAEGHYSYEIFGAGNQSCAAYVKAYEVDAVRLMYEQWILGFVSAINFQLNQENALLGTNHPTDLGKYLSDAFGAEVYNTCKAEPLLWFSDAVESLIIKLYNAKVKD